MTTPLFLLRCMDIWTEKANDDVKYEQIATQEDFDKF